MVSFGNNDYFGAMDRFGEDNGVITPMMSEDREAVKDALDLGTAEIGTTTNPMGNTLESLKSRINEGAGKLEFSFIGSGKGNAQSPTPESFGVRERRDMKELLTINDIKSSVHAAVHGESLAGFGQGGFNGQQRQAALNEINRAIDFAGDVTDGGALVFHLTEWQRPMTYAGTRSMANESQWMFKGYDTEESDTQLLVVDSRTGKFIEGIQKDKLVYEPVYLKVSDDENMRSMVGQTVEIKDSDNNVIKHTVAADDWITVDGRVIPKYAQDTRLLFDRMPAWDKENTNFKIEPVSWDKFVDRAKEWNRTHPDKQVTPEELYARTEMESRVLQAKGSSLFHAQNYNDYRDRRDKLREALKLYEAYEGDIPEEELERMKQLVPERFGAAGQFTTSDRMLPTEIIRKELTDVENHMRHIHESSATADAQAKQYEDMIEHMQTVENYGLNRTADSIAKIGMQARETTHRKGLKNPIYAAPENWDQKYFGSHPDEMRRIIEASREQMAKRLLAEKKVSGEKQAKEEAAKHIKATLDIGHMNMWRQYFNPTNPDGTDKYKSAQDREKAFEKWMLDETEKLAKAGVVGHIHLADNFGYGDEHLTPGEGNIPMKEFLKRMQKAGMRDMIVEPGSYNVSTSMYDTLSLVGSPVYGVGRAPRFNRVHQQHFGYNAPSFFIAGSYAPSNDWRPWTEVPLE